MVDWKQSFDIINSYLIESKILNYSNEILYCINGDYMEAANYIGSKNLCLVSNDIKNFEFSTINFMKKDLSVNNRKALYVHTKGASTGINKPVRDWIETMCYFNISCFEQRLLDLEVYDATGVDYHESPFRHFSGNFWWSKSSHIKKLPLLTNEDRHAAERWVCSRSGLFKSAHNTNIPVYERHLHEYSHTKYR